MKIVLLVIVIIWLVSYIKFRMKMRYFKAIASCLETRNAMSHGSDPDILIRLSSAYMLIQKYQKAYDCLNLAKESGLLTPDRLADVQTNMAFCEKPISSYTRGGRNRNTYLHYFLLNRLGRKRRIFLKQEDYDAGKAKLRGF